MANGGIIGPQVTIINSVASPSPTKDFTAPGTYTAPSTVKLVDYLVVAGGGGGGAGGNGVDGGYYGSGGGNGGPGLAYSISGSSVGYAGGGTSAGAGAANQASSGGGTINVNGTTNTGGGSGAGTGFWGGVITNNTGGSGVAVIRYADSEPAATLTTGSPNVTVAGGWRTYRFWQSGSITL